MTLDELKATLETFSPRQLEFVATVVDSLSNPPQADIRQRCTWLTGSANWMEYFGLALSVHHGATTEPLGLTAFETVFRNACRAAGVGCRSARLCHPALCRCRGPVRQ